MTGIAAAAQSLQPGARVELFRLDLTALGGGVVAFTPSSAQAIVFQGVEYAAIEIEAEGFELSASGQLPTPRLRLSNLNRVGTALIVAYADLLGAEVTRIVTFAQFLDGAPEADPTQHFPPDVFRVERKVTATAKMVEWELSSVLDQEGRKLPGRQVLRDACTHAYRTWTGDGYSYARATCPYTGGVAWDVNGKAVEPARDVCGKRLSDCRLRFGENGVLPTRAFPGVARLRV